MDKELFIKAVQQALAKKECIVSFISCEVEYDGRAKSTLAKGDRLLIIKPDSTILVHQPTKHTPVNYMPPGTVHDIKEKNGVVVIESMNPKTRESLTVCIGEVYSHNSQGLIDPHTLERVGTEADMAQYIMDNPKVISDSFAPTKREEQTTYGFVDVVGTDNGDLVIIECKRYAADLQAVTQLRRYVERVKKSKGVGSVKGILAAPRITDNAHKMLRDFGFEFKNVTPPFRYESVKKKQTVLSDHNLGEYGKKN